MKNEKYLQIEQNLIEIIGIVSLNTERYINTGEKIIASNGGFE
jgi:hypothetical protein